jgi:predicted acylesterase/phospholipase RssA/CRP-like cAMP-binding protein
MPAKYEGRSCVTGDTPVPADVGDGQDDRGRLAVALRNSKAFRGLDTELRLDLESVLEPVLLSGGEALFHKGDTGDSLYLVVNGRLKEHCGANDFAGREYTTGDTLGEGSVIASATRSATVVAIRDSFLARLSSSHFEQVCSRHAISAIGFFTRKLIETEKEPARRLRPAPRTIALIASHRSVNLEAFARQLAACLGSGSRRVLLLNSKSVNSVLGVDASCSIFGGSHDASLVTWLNSKELAYDCVLYQTDHAGGPWTSRCLRQADRIVLVADGTRAPSPSCFKSLAFAKGQPARLVIIHPPGVQPTGTIAWLDAYPFEHYYHVHEGDTADLLRLSRCLMNRGLGLVLGGGFARGVAHLGILRALSELGITHDAIGGTSMGSLIAALHLCGLREEDLYPMLLAQGKSALRDFTFPMVALLSGRKVREILEPLVGDKRMEDLWLPVFFVATNLTRGRIEVLDRGPVLDALLASSRVPGMFPPVARGTDLLVDGGLVNNVPADVMRDFCPGRVVAVNVSPKVDFKANSGASGEASGWKLLRDCANPFVESQEWPSVFSVLMRTMTFTSDSHIERIREMADLYLAPPTADFAFNDFDRGPEMAEKAYRYARPEIVRWMKRAARKARAERNDLLEEKSTN